MKIQLSISPKFARNVTLALCLVVFGFAVLSIASGLVGFFFFSDLASQAGNGDGKIALLYLPADNNITEWYSSSMLLICSIVLAIIAVAVRGGHVPQWTGLSIVFLYLSADEASSIHEKIGEVLDGRLQTSGVLYYAWVIPYIVFVLVFVLGYLRFLRRLPPKIMQLFVTAGVLYVAGALGGEMAEGYYTTLYDNSGPAYSAMMHVEEVLEMLGVLVLFYALLSYIGLYSGGLEIGAEGASPDDRA